MSKDPSNLGKVMISQSVLSKDPSHQLINGQLISDISSSNLHYRDNQFLPNLNQSRSLSQMRNASVKEFEH